MKDKKCKHKWHFMEKESDGGTVYKWGRLGIYPCDYIPSKKTFAVFVCEFCGELKKVEIENENI